MVTQESDVNMVIDTHVHFPNIPGYLDELMETAARLGIDRMVLFSGAPGSRWASNDMVLEASHRHPQVFIPFYCFRPGVNNPKEVEDAYKSGFKGLKVINPTSNYNDENYFPIWERCEHLGMPVLFHTGIIARRPEQVDQDIDSSRMKVIYLDRIARRFQKLTMLVAHLGNPDHAEACMMCRWHANMYFDLSGSTLKYRKPSFFREMFWWDRDTQRYRDEFGRGPWEKIIFGTDVSPAEMEDVMNDYRRLFRALRLSPELQAAVMGKTAARLLSVSSPGGEKQDSE